MTPPSVDLIGEFSRSMVRLGPKVVVAFAIFATFWVISRISHHLLLRAYLRSDNDAKDLFLLFQKSTTAVLMALGIITALGTVGINASALVAGLGLTGFAMGFAFKDALSNLLAGTMLLFYRPFRRGDKIVITGLEGTVAEINLRYTILASADRTFLVPNSLLLTNSITVLRRTHEPEQVSL